MNYWAILKRGWYAVQTLLVLLCCVGMPGAVAETIEGVWDFSTNSQGAPSVTLNRQALAELETGDVFPLQLGSGDYHVELERTFYLDNGDVSWHGRLRENGGLHAFVMTRGRASVHASITTSRGIHQLYARENPDGNFSGELTRHSPVRDRVPDENLVRPPDGGEGDAQSGTYRVTQHVPQKQVRQGRDVTIELGVVNTSGETRRDVYVDVFFLLENTSLVSAPDACFSTHSTEGQPVLSCRLGDLSPSAGAELRYTVATSQESHPIVYSTAMVEDVRDDLVLEVFRDVVTDTDGDGISDFNERLLGSDPNDGFSVRGEDNTVIDVMAVMTRDAEALYESGVETRLNHLFSVANLIYADSGVAITLRLVRVLRSGYTPASSLETDLTHLTYKTAPSLDQVDRIRRREGADLVALFRPMAGTGGVCGLANLAGQGLRGDFSADYHKEFAYSVISIDCPNDSVLAHEVGHNMGLVHSRLEDTEGGTFHYSAGHGLPPEEGFAGFSTVMAYAGDFDTDHIVFRFSNPGIYCDPSRSRRCGVDATNPDVGADAAASLDLVRHQIAAYLPSLEERLTPLPVTTRPREAAPMQAVILAGATSEGRYHGSRLPASGRYDVEVIFQPDPAHVGQLATQYMIIRLPDGRVFQLNQAGRLEEWNGEVGGLKALREPRRLSQDIRISPLRGVSPADHGLSGGDRVSLFFAYRIADSGQLVFSASPLELVITSP